LYPLAKVQYQALAEQEQGKMDGQAYNRRKLKNTCLWLLMKADEESALAWCQQQYRQAKTMTDQIASFALLANSQQAQVRQEAIATFYKQWANNDLVLDKWFSIQATCEQPGTLDAVTLLMKHPAFSMKNPNKVRALIGAFCQANPNQFHDRKGDGYAFLGDILVVLDPLNPQIASRLATPFTRWQRFDKPRQVLMQEQLQRLAKLSISADLREIVSKSIQHET
jgi:aminopeptidase N